MQLNALRELGLLTLRNHLNQQMIIQQRDKINSRLQREVQARLEKDQQTELKKIKLIKNKSRLPSLNTATNNKKRKKFKNFKRLESAPNGKEKDELDNYSPQSEADQLNLEEQNFKEALIELACLRNFNYVNHQLFDFIKDLDQPKRTLVNDANENSKNFKLTNEFEANKKTEQFESNERADILEEEKLRNSDDLDGNEDKMNAMSNCKPKKSKDKKFSKIKRFKSLIRQTYRCIDLHILSSLRNRLLNFSIRFEEIEKHHLFIEQLNASGNLELSSPLPANVPYCQIGKSSLIAALKQFNWSHTQGPFIYNQNW